mgnify:CR=1 FL=1
MAVYQTIFNLFLYFTEGLIIMQILFSNKNTIQK